MCGCGCDCACVRLCLCAAVFVCSAQVIRLLFASYPCMAKEDATWLSRATYQVVECCTHALGPAREEAWDTFAQVLAALCAALKKSADAGAGVDIVERLVCVTRYVLQKTISASIPISVVHLLLRRSEPTIGYLFLDALLDCWALGMFSTECVTDLCVHARGLLRAHPSLVDSVFKALSKSEAGWIAKIGGAVLVPECVASLIDVGCTVDSGVAPGMFRSRLWTTGALCTRAFEGFFCSWILGFA